MRVTGFLLAVFLVLALIQSWTAPLFVATETGYLAQPYDLRGLAKAAIYAGAWLSCALAVGALFLLRPPALRWLALAAAAVAVAADLFVQLLANARGWNAFEWELVLAEAGNFWRLVVFREQLLLAIAAAGLGTAALAWLGARTGRTLSPLWLAAVPLAGLFSGYAALEVDSIKTDAFPAPIKVPTIAAHRALYARPAPVRVLDAAIVPARPPAVRDLVWVVDESVTGTYLALNGYPRDTTPELARLAASGQLANFGVVSSVSNCSALSHLLLRIGASPERPDEFREALDGAPTIFQLAKRAGYTTRLYDAQVVPGELQNYLSVSDMEHVDHYETVDRTARPHERDRRITERLLRDLAASRDRPDFVILVKYGAHWPYLLGYPKDREHFRPVRGSTAETMNAENRAKAVNTYLNLIRWAVDDYLTELAGRLELGDTVVFYTSDHGQSIAERGLTRTHCSRTNPPTSQAAVPLLVLTERAPERFPVRPDRGYTQAQLFPTTLALMGYGPDVVDAYGPGLEDGLPTDAPRSFYSSGEGDRAEFVPPERSPS